MVHANDIRKAVPQRKIWSTRVATAGIGIVSFQLHRLAKIIAVFIIVMKTYAKLKRRLVSASDKKGITDKRPEIAIVPAVVVAFRAKPTKAIAEAVVQT